MAQKFKYLNLDYLENYGKNYFKMDVSAELMTIRNKENSNCSLGCFDRMPQSMQGNLNENVNNSMSSSLRIDMCPNESATVVDENNNVMNGNVNTVKKNHCSLI